MGNGTPAVRRTTQTSNIEFVSSIRTNILAAQKMHQDEKSWRSWSTVADDAIHVPSHSFDKTGLAEDRDAYEITVKLFFLPDKSASSRCQQTREAIKIVLKELHVSNIDLLIVSYPRIAFDAEDEDADEDEDDDAETPESPQRATDGRANAEDVDTLLSTWECLEEHYDAGVIKKLGVSEFGASRLASFLQKARVRPGVDQINVRDCCVVPQGLIGLAKREKVELLTHNDCTNILPSGTLREMLGNNGDGFGVLTSEADVDGIRGDVEPQWVIKYTAVVKDRGVIENKGYFAMAEVNEV